MRHRNESLLRRLGRGLLHTIDWKFILALVFAITIAHFIAIGVRQDQRVDELIRQGDAKDAAAVRAREQGSAERAQLLVTQRALIRQVRQLTRRQEQLLDYLRDQGVPLPPNNESRGSQKASPTPPAGSPHGASSGPPAVPSRPSSSPATPSPTRPPAGAPAGGGAPPAPPAPQPAGVVGQLLDTLLGGRR